MSMGYAGFHLVFHVGVGGGGITTYGEIRGGDVWLYIGASTNI